MADYSQNTSPILNFNTVNCVTLKMKSPKVCRSANVLSIDSLTAVAVIIEQATPHPLPYRVLPEVPRTAEKPNGTILNWGSMTCSHGMGL